MYLKVTKIQIERWIRVILMNPSVLFALLILLSLSQSIDIYFVRHGARSPLVVPMQDVFGVENRKLTAPGKIQSYFFGKQLYARHFKTSPKLLLFSTNYERTLRSAQYFLKGWYGISKKGNYSFNPDPQYRPPSNISISLFKEHYLVDEYQYSHLILDLPYMQDNTNRQYKKYRVRNGLKHRYLVQKVRQNQDLCRKFQSQIPGSCSKMSINEFFNFVDIMNCLNVINKTVPGVTKRDMNFPLQLINDTYNRKFREKSFPTKAVQQDFLLVQDLYNKKSADVAVILTHDSHLFYFIRSLIGIEKLMVMFDRKMVMSFMSCLHLSLKNGVAKLYFNDKQFQIPSCGTPCSIKKLFHIMNN